MLSRKALGKYAFSYSCYLLPELSVAFLGYSALIKPAYSRIGRK